MPDIADNERRHRFEMMVDDQMAYVDYDLKGREITLLHTEVPSALGGRGVGSALAEAVLSTVRDRGLKVVPECAFIAKYIARHPEFAGIVAEPRSR